MMAVVMPSRVAWPAAMILVYMPPVPREEPAPPAMRRVSSVTSSTTWISGASGFCFGFSACRPSMSVRITSASAFTMRATTADRVSLSPNSISSVATVSFSLMIGSAPRSSRRSKALRMLDSRRGSSTQSRVSSTWAVVWPYSPKNLS